MYIYKMESGELTVEQRIAQVLANATDEQFIKHMPKPAADQVEVVFSNPSLNALIIDCADVQKNGGYEKVAHKHGVEVSFVKRIEKATSAEWARRQAEAAAEAAAEEPIVEE